MLQAAACDVLDVEPQSSIPAEAVFTDKTGIERGIAGAYSALQSLSYYGRTYILFSDLAADNLSHPPNATASAYRQVDNNAILPENESVDGIWSAIYDALNVANNVIVQVPNMADMSETEKNEALAELYFLRALHHFNLTNYFGAIPIKTAPTVGAENVDVPRDLVIDVYAQIIADLTFAATHLPDNAGRKIRATRAAAHALLARVYLYQRDYAKAATEATTVIEHGGYALAAPYSAVFADDESEESIFEVDFNAVDRNRIAEYNFPLTLNGRGEVRPSDDIVALFDGSDPRHAASIAKAGTLSYAIKYDDLSIGADNVVVLRLAEMYLIRAEALARSSAAAADVLRDLNTVRSRAQQPNLTEASTPDLLLAIEAERRTELAFEGHRWFDLVRTGRAVAVLPGVTDPNQTLFPIPLSEILANKNPGMQQNPGY